MIKLGKTYSESKEGSWGREEALLKIYDDRDNIVSVLKQNSEEAKKSFASANKILSMSLKRQVLERIKKAHRTDILD